MYSEETVKIIKRLQKARLSLMKNRPFYAVLLFHVRFSVDPMCETAYTDGSRIAICPDFLEELSNSELEFVLMHEVLHIALNHCFRAKEDYDFDRFDRACDIVVNSNILYSSNFDLNAITLRGYGPGMHTTPKGDEGYLYSAEEVYKMLCEEDGNQSEANGEQGTGAGFDDHTYWDCSSGSSGGDGSGSDAKSENEAEQVRIQRIIDATGIAAHIAARKGNASCGNIPLFAERLLSDLTRPKTGWREVLQNFVQEEITDYSFEPPDRRMQDSAFLLPDFNEKDEDPKNIWFCIDTSGSLSDGQVAAAYSELCGAIEQFEGHLTGWLSLFDTKITKPERFESVDDVLAIKPVGGGGTSFGIIFRMLKELQGEMEIACIVIITDGYGVFPEEAAALGIPVLWLLSSNDAESPWGKVARMAGNC